MLRSKASAALARLKEFDKKYKLRADRSSEIAASGSSPEPGVSSLIGRIEPAPDGTIGATSKSKLDIRIPDARGTSGRTPDESAPSSKRVAALSPASERSRAENTPGSASESSNPAISSAPGLSTGSSGRLDRYYGSDTFEEASTSSIRSGSTAPEAPEDLKEKQVIELVSPKAMQSISECDIELDEELSEYIKTIDSLDRDTVEMTPITLLKTSPKPPGTPGKRVKSSRPARTVPKQSIIELYKTQDRMIDVESKKSSSYEEISNYSSPSIPPTEPPGETDRERSDFDISSGTNQSSLADHQKSPPASQKSPTDKQSVSPKKQSPKRVDPHPQKEGEKGQTLQLLEEDPEDELGATDVLRKLNRQAINAIVKRHKVPQNQNAPEITESSEENGSIISVRKIKLKKAKPTSGTSTAKPSNLRRDRVRSEKSVSKESQRTSKESQRASKESQRASKESQRASKESQRASKESQRPSKESQRASKESQRAKKRLVTQKLEQERENLSNFLLELDRLHFLEGAKPIPKAPLIRPLELPNVQAFRPPDDREDAILKPITDVERIGDKLCEIQLWLKDQYALYREYSRVAQIVNAKYAPSNLEDAKKVIRELKSRTKKIVPPQ